MGNCIKCFTEIEEYCTDLSAFLKMLMPCKAESSAVTLDFLGQSSFVLHAFVRVYTMFPAHAVSPGAECSNRDSIGTIV